MTLIESLILAQDERWRRALNMQVERAALIFNMKIGVFKRLTFKELVIWNFDLGIRDWCG